MKERPVRYHLDGAVLQCLTCRGREAVTVLDAQCRATQWAYLVTNGEGKLMVTWPERPPRMTDEVKANLRQIDRVDVRFNPNVSVLDRVFASKLYIPY